MASRYLSGRTAILAAAIYPLAGCDIPLEATPSAEIARIDDIPALEDLYLEEIKTNGKGCPKDDPDSVQVVISDDRKSFAILYRDMELTNPPGPPIKNLSCQTAVKLHVPDGYQIALETVSVRGYLYLDEKIKARVTSGYFFAGVPIGTIPHTTMVGPFDDYYEFSDNIPFESLVWSPCGSSAIFGINTIMSLNAKDNPDGTALFNVEGDFRSIPAWIIRAC